MTKKCRQKGSDPQCEFLHSLFWSCNVIYCNSFTLVFTIKYRVNKKTVNAIITYMFPLTDHPLYFVNF